MYNKYAYPEIISNQSVRCTYRCLPEFSKNKSKITRGFLRCQLRRVCAWTSLWFIDNWWPLEGVARITHMPQMNTYLYGEGMVRCGVWWRVVCKRHLQMLMVEVIKCCRRRLCQWHNIKSSIFICVVNVKSNLSRFLTRTLSRRSRRSVSMDEVPKKDERSSLAIARCCRGHSADDFQSV